MCSVESGVAVVGVTRPDAFTGPTIVFLREDGPGRATGDNDGLGLVVVIQLGSTDIVVLFAPDEELVKIKVDCVGRPAIRSPCVPDTGDDVVKHAGHIGAVVVTKHPPVCGTMVAFIVGVVRVHQPDTGDAAGRDPVVKVVVSKGINVGNCSESVSSLVGVVVAVHELVLGPGFGDPWPALAEVQALCRNSGGQR